MPEEKPIHFAICGLGGQGVITLTKLIAEAYKLLGKEVSYNEVHGLSQRGGTVQSLLTVNSKNTPIFALDQTDYLIGLEKLEALRFLYASKAKPTVLLGDKYEIRNTVYFQMEYFAPEDDIDKEIYALADRLYKFNSVEYEKTLQFKIKSTNIAIFGMLSQFHELGLTEKIIKKVVRQQFKKNPMAQSYNLQALKEGKAWFQAVKVPNS